MEYCRNVLKCLVEMRNRGYNANWSQMTSVLHSLLLFIIGSWIMNSNVLYSRATRQSFVTCLFLISLENKHK